MSAKCETCGVEMVAPFNVAYRPTKQYLCYICFNDGIPVKEYPRWVEIPAQCHPELTRWLENPDDGDIISVVKLHFDKPSRLGIDGEIRASTPDDCFSIPCTLDIVSRKSSAELIRLVKRHQERRREIK